jgi:hypothetical protein
MRYKVPLILGMLLFSLPAISAQVSRVTKISDGVYEVVIDGVVTRAYTADELRKKLLVMSDLKSHIEALEKLKDAQASMIEGQKAQLDRMAAQLADYRTLNTKLEQLLRLSPGFSTSAGLGYLNSEAAGMLGFGYGDWRLMGLLQPSSAGFLISKDF